jgi:hypothetical protein
VYNIVRKKESGTPKNREREKKMKVVVNKCYGGFGLSTKARKMLHAEDIAKVWELEETENRNNPELINAVETLGDEVNTRSSELKVVTLPEDTTDWEINEYDGFETVTYVRNGKIFHA